MLRQVYRTRAERLDTAANVRCATTRADSGCTPESHAAAKASREAFIAATVNHRPWPGSGLMLAECAGCSSTLGFEEREAA